LIGDLQPTQGLSPCDVGIDALAALLLSFKAVADAA
jgi:hypothetical protein